MLFFIFLVATLNLAVGYALGAGLSLSMLLDRLPKRAAKPASDDLDDDEPLTRPAPAAEEAPVEASVPEAEPVAESVEASSPTASAGATSPTSTADIMSGLASFRQKLSSASDELKLNKENPEKFEASATKLQEVNHAYIEEAEDAVHQLDELGAQGDATAAATREAVAAGTSEMATLSEGVDKLIEGGLDDESRQQLLDKSSEMTDAANRLQAAAAVAPAASGASEAEEPTSAPPANAGKRGDDEARVVESVDQLFERLVGALAEVEDAQPLPVAAMQIDPIDGKPLDAPLMEAIEKGVAQVAAELLGETQTFMAGQPGMALLEGDTFEAATERLESLRRQVAANTFAVNGEEHKVTITCALAEAKSGNARQDLMDQLQQALDESTRSGTNRTFHHDGAFPTLVPEASAPVDPKTVTVA